MLWVVVEAARGREPAAAGRCERTGRVAVIALGVSVWWLVGVRLQGRTGSRCCSSPRTCGSSPSDRCPATCSAASATGSSTGATRPASPLDQAAAYDSDRLVVALSYAVPVVGLVAALCIRWAHRAYFILLIVVGVGGRRRRPGRSPTRRRTARRGSASPTRSLGLAFRNSPRAVPLVVLGFAGLLAAAVGSLPRGPLEARGRWRGGGAGRWARCSPCGTDGYLSDGVDRPEDIPDYWQAAGDDLDAGDHATRILELPGSTFAAYRWGDLVDPLTPGLTDRPYLAREVLPHGTVPSVNLLDALDRRAQLGVLESESIAPIAHLLGIGTISLRADLEQSERAFAPDPAPVWDALTAAPRACSTPEHVRPAGR